ncbi:MAG: hypothetical protein M1831_000714 [Alyxoria varia]|nr:MAG: hypothetical protein M1831_000714 [Alyxoria varia]
MKFYDGDLQSGISLAVQQGKHVLCFVNDESDESKFWESELLTDQWTPEGMLRHTVGLKIQAGSQEAGFLSAIYPTSETPTILIIHQGKVLEQIGPGTEKEAFAERIRGAVTRDMPDASQSDGSNPPMPPSQMMDRLPSSQTEQNASAQTNAVPTTTSNSTSQATDSPSNQNNANTTTSAASSRSAQHPSAPNTAISAASTPPSTNKGKGKAAPTPPSHPSTTQPQRNQQVNEAATQRLRQKQEADRERSRILARVEADKIERRKQAQDARLTRQEEGAQQQESESIEAAHSKKPVTDERALRAGCALQVRQLDGSVLRSRFQTDDTLNGAVRKFVDGKRSDGGMPYTFKVVLTPQPSRAVSGDEESQPLKDLGLAPSATLVLVPVQNVVRAYEGSQGGIIGFFNSVMAMIVGFVAAVWGAIVAFVGSISERGTTSSSPVGNSDPSSASASAGGSDAKRSSASTTAGNSSSSNIRVHTLRDQSQPKNNDAGRRGRATDRQGNDDDPDQLYNGNTLNFEPKNERDDDESGK